MGYHTTATQVIQARPDLSGQVAVVTGGSSGIGVETVRALASAGIDCVLCCRNVEAGQRVAAELQPEAVGKITVQCLDLCDLSSVHAAATQLAAQLPRLDMLVLNAGVMAPRAVDGKPQRTADGFELQFGTNHLSHFYLCKLLLPKMKASVSSQTSPCTETCRCRFSGQQSLTVSTLLSLAGFSWAGGCGLKQCLRIWTNRPGRPQLHQPHLQALGWL